MTDNAALLALLLVFWAGLWLTLRVVQVLARRAINDGPSLLPVVPAVPLIALGAGFLLNALMPWLGTGIVMAAHAACLLLKGKRFGPKHRRPGG